MWGAGVGGKEHFMQPWNVPGRNGAKRWIKYNKTGGLRLIHSKIKWKQTRAERRRAAAATTLASPAAGGAVEVRRWTFLIHQSSMQPNRMPVFQLAQRFEVGGGSWFFFRCVSSSTRLYTRHVLLANMKQFPTLRDDFFLLLSFLSAILLQVTCTKVFEFLTN